MTREPVNIEFILKGDVDKEIEKVRLSMKRVGTEGAVSYKNLLNASNEAFLGLSKDAQRQAVALQTVITQIKQNELAQDSLKKKYKDGEISAKAYAEASARLSVHQAELKAQAGGLSAQLQHEIEMGRKVEGSYNQKIAKIKELQEAYRNLDESERNNVAIGGQMIESIRKLEAETKKLEDTVKGSSKSHATSIDGMKAKLSELQKSYNSLSEAERKNKAVGGELQKQIKALSGQIDKAENSNRNFIEKLEQAPGALGAAVTGIKAMTKASLAFIATPIGAVIALLVGAFMALKTMFNRTAEGQHALAVGSAAFMQVLDSLLNVVVKVGEWLFKAFTSPKEAARDLVQFMKDQVMNRFEAIGKMGQAIGKIFSEDWKQGFKDLGNAVLQFQTGIENAGQKAADWADKTSANAIKRAKIAGELHELDLKQIAVNTKIAEQEARIAELRAKAKDNKEDGAQRLKLIKEAQDIINQNAESEVGIAQRRLELTREEIKLKYGRSDNLPKDEVQRLSDMEIALARVKKQKFNDQRELLDQQNAINGQMATANKKTQLEAFDEELKIKKEQYQLFYGLMAATDKEYARKQFAELTAQGDSYLQYINQKIAELKGKTNRSAFEDTQLSTLTGVANDLTGSGSATDQLKNELAAKKKQYAEDLEAYAQYLQDRRALLESDQSEEGARMKTTLAAEITETEETRQQHLDELLKKYQGYSARMASLTADYWQEMKVLEKSGNAEAIKTRTEAYNAAIADLELGNAEFTKVLFGDLEKMSKKSIDAAIAKAKEWVAQYRAAHKDIDAETDQLLKDLEEGIKNAENTAGDKLPKAFQQVADGLKEAAGFAALFDSELANVIDTAAQIAQGMADMATGIARIASGDVVGGIMQTFQGIVKIVAGIKKNLDESKKVKAEYEAMLLKRNMAEMEYTALLRERLLATKQIGETELQYNQRITAELNKQKEATSGQYSQLLSQLQGEKFISGTTLKKGNWFKKAKTVNEYASLMGKTYEDIERLYNSNQLDDKAKILFEQLQKIKDEGVDINAMIAEQAESMREALTGTTADAITDSIVSGFENGYKTAADFAENFKGMMKKAMLQALKLQVLEEPIRKWYESFASSMTAGTITEDMAALNKSYNDIISKGAEWMTAAEKATGMSFANTAQQSASSSSIQTINQETASKLEGHFVAVRVNTARLVETVASISDRMARQVLHLAAIEKNTNELSRLENIENVLKRVENDGIKLKG